MFRLDWSVPLRTIAVLFPNVWRTPRHLGKLWCIIDNSSGWLFELTVGEGCGKMPSEKTRDGYNTGCYKRKPHLMGDKWSIIFISICLFSAGIRIVLVTQKTSYPRRSNKRQLWSLTSQMFCYLSTLIPKVPWFPTASFYQWILTISLPQKNPKSLLNSQTRAGNFISVIMDTSFCINNSLHGSVVPHSARLLNFQWVLCELSSWPLSQTHLFKFRRRRRCRRFHSHRNIFWGWAKTIID